MEGRQRRAQSFFLSTSALVDISDLPAPSEIGAHDPKPKIGEHKVVRYLVGRLDTVRHAASIAMPGQSLTQNALYGCEHMVFNPWNCLPEHRPLGSVDRMRLAVHLASRQLQRNLNMVGHEQPAEARSFGRTSADTGAAECRE
jgi:hypothetical protein